MERLRAKEGVSARALEFTDPDRRPDRQHHRRQVVEIDKGDRLWTVPGPQLKGEKGKKRSDHVVPLADRSFPCCRIFRGKADFIFPGGVAKRERSRTRHHV